MSKALRIEFDDRALVRAIKALSERDIQDARRLALNRAAPSGAAAARKAVSQETKIKPKFIKKRISVFKARGRSGKKASGAGMYFKFRDKNPGTMDPVAVGGRGGKGGYIKASNFKWERAWVMGGRNGNSIIMQRVGDARMPIHAVKIPIGLPAVDAAARAFKPVASKTFVARFEHEVKRKIAARGLSGGTR